MAERAMRYSCSDLDAAALEKSLLSLEVRSLSEFELNLIYKLLPVQTRISAP